MFGDGALSFREFAMREKLPLATIHDAVLEFLRGRDDAVLFGAQAVNAYVRESRMTEDVDILSMRAPELAEELRDHLNKRFHIAVRVRKVTPASGGCASGGRLASASDGRRSTGRRSSRAACGEGKSLLAAPGLAKIRTDWRDIAILLLTFPKLKASRGPVRERLEAAGADAAILAAWDEIAAQKIIPEGEDDKFT